MLYGDTIANIRDMSGGIEERKKVKGIPKMFIKQRAEGAIAEETFWICHNCGEKLASTTIVRKSWC